ncbi:MAG: metallophosphoesterase [Halobacteriota archaeon]|nr:metallophosphoesterase [Halobacteriota archaeon]
MKRYLVIADIHGSVKAIEGLTRTIDVKKFDSMLIAGDIPITTPPRLMVEYILKHGNLSRESYSRWAYNPKGGRRKFLNYQLKSSELILNRLEGQKLPVFYTPGNVDCLEVQDLIKANHPHVRVVDDSYIKLHDGVLLVGISGALNRFGCSICDGDVSEEIMNEKIGLLRKRISSEEKIILLTHEPPQFRIKSGRRMGLVRGSRAITELIKDILPEFVICAHFHEHAGIYNLDKIPVINPGSLATYRYALISYDEDDGCVKCELKLLKRKFMEPISFIYAYREHLGEEIELLD